MLLVGSVLRGGDSAAVMLSDAEEHVLNTGAWDLCPAPHPQMLHVLLVLRTL